MKYFLLLLAICYLLLIAACQEPVTKVFMVRHADRQGQADDLSNSGVVRANELIRVLGLAGIDSIYSINFITTKKTGKPLATLRAAPYQNIYKHTRPNQSYRS